MSLVAAGSLGDARTGREPLLDLLRGFFLVLMTVDHLDGVLSKYCYEAFGFVTAAEGFVVLSGVVSARVYGRMLARDPARFGRAVTRRVALLYAAHAVLVTFVAVSVWGRAHPPNPGDPYAPFAYEPVEYFAKALSFRFQPYLLDVLPMYVLFVAGLPVLLRWIERSRTTVLMSSLGLWGLSFVLDAKTWVEGSGLFVFPSWQLLFVGGALLANLSDRVLRGIVGSRLVALVALSIVGFGLGCRYGIIDWGARVPWLLDRSLLGPFRLLTVLAYAALIARYRGRLRTGLRSKWVEHLGKHSLYVFVWHLPVVLWCKPRGVMRLAATSLGVPEIGQLEVALDIAVTGLCVASLSIPALLHAQWRSSASVARA